MATGLKEVTKLLEEILHEKSESVLRDKIRSFQDLIWNGDVSEEVDENESLSDLALDLDYFSPQETKEPFFGVERLKKEISDVLSNL